MPLTSVQSCSSLERADKRGDQRGEDKSGHSSRSGSPALRQPGAPAARHSCSHVAEVGVSLPRSCAWVIFVERSTDYLSRVPHESDLEETATKALPWQRIEDRVRLHSLVCARAPREAYSNFPRPGSRRSR